MEYVNVISNETDGFDFLTYEDIQCEHHKKIIMIATSLGSIEFDKQFEEIFDTKESDDEPRVHIEGEFERQYEDIWINLITLFKSAQTQYLSILTSLNILCILNIVGLNFN